MPSAELIQAGVQVVGQVIGGVTSTIQAGYQKDMFGKELDTRKEMAVQAQKAAFDQQIASDVSEIGDRRQQKNLAKIAADSAPPSNPNLALYIGLGITAFLAIGDVFFLIFNQKKK